MGTLKHQASGLARGLLPRQLLGRSAACHVRLGSEAVSLEHAVIWWEAEAWWVKDLGSSNGTRVGTRLLGPGERLQLREGSHLEFGDAEELWQLVAAERPGSAAVPLEGGSPVFGGAELLALPDDESPRLVLHRTARGTWLAEGAASTCAVSDNEVLLVEDRPWRVHLPIEVDHTDRSRTSLHLPELALTLTVSRNEEHVQARLSACGRDVELPDRAHLHPLVVLARARLEDAELPEAEQGWLERERLLEMLRIEAAHLNVLFYRARRQLAEAGIRDVGALVERRSGDRELRLGIARLRVREA